jgi:DNA mismatch repair protein MutL
MRHPYFAKAVNSAFEDIIPQGEQVPFFLCIDVEPSRIDVNIHPTKTEIKFENESDLWKIISAAVREALGRFNATPSLDFDDDNIPDIPVMDISGTESTPVSAPRVSYNPGYNPFKNRMPDYRKSDSSWEMLYEDASDSKPLDLSPFEDTALFESETPLYNTNDDASFVEEYVPMSQYKGQYILIPVKSGLMWVHQRRAHIRVLFEKYKEQIRDKRAVSQGLLFPERVDVTLNESVTIENIQEELSFLGFDISSLGGGSFAINGVPSGIEGLSPVKLLMDIVHGVMDETNNAKAKIDERIALSMAKDVAVVAGQLLSAEEMTSLVDDLFRTAMPSITPDGQTIVYIMPDKDIERNFSK